MQPKADLQPFADWLRARMRERRLGQNQVAEYLGIGGGGVSEYLRAIRRPRLETLRKISAYFDTPIETLEALLPDALPSSPKATDDLPAAARGIAQAAAEQALRAWMTMQRGGDQQMHAASAGPGAPADPIAIRSIAGSFRHGLQPVEVVGDCLEPRLRPGWIAWVNPEVTGRPGDIVLALVENEQMFKILNRTGEMAFLEALDGRPAIPVGPNVTIQGVVQLVQHSP